MNKTNFNHKTELNETGNKVLVTDTYEVDRYTPCIIGSCEAECEATIDEIMDCSKIWTSQKGDYKTLTNVELDPNEIFTGETLEEDRLNYQKTLLVKENMKPLSLAHIYILVLLLVLIKLVIMYVNGIQVSLDLLD